MYLYFVTGETLEMHLRFCVSCSFRLKRLARSILIQGAISIRVSFAFSFRPRVRISLRPRVRISSFCRCLLAGVQHQRKTGGNVHALHTNHSPRVNLHFKVARPAVVKRPFSIQKVKRATSRALHQRHPLDPGRFS